MGGMRTEPLRPLETTWEEWTLGGGPRAAFTEPDRPLEVEIGPGDDDFLLESALGHPERNWLGIEYSRKRIGRQVRRTLDRAGELPNLRLAWRPAADVVLLLAPAQVRTFHIYFPDPWPKKHHHRYRLLTPGFLRDLGASLEEAGEVRIVTDHFEYVEDMLAAFAEVDGFASLIPSPGYAVVAASEQTTAFEQRWRAAGLQIYRLAMAWGG